MPCACDLLTATSNEEYIHMCCNVNGRAAPRCGRSNDDGLVGWQTGREKNVNIITMYYVSGREMTRRATKQNSAGGQRNTRVNRRMFELLLRVFYNLLCT
jgi:hypothetical protein